jgi:cell division protein FtsZ
MIASGLSGVDFIVANTDAQALASSRAERVIQTGLQVTEGLCAGARPKGGKAAAEEALDEICDHLAGSHMVFLTAGMGEAPAQARPPSSPERLVRWASSLSAWSPSPSTLRAAAG